MHSTATSNHALERTGSAVTAPAADHHRLFALVTKLRLVTHLSPKLRFASVGPLKALPSDRAMSKRSFGDGGITKRSLVTRGTAPRVTARAFCERSGRYVCGVLTSFQRWARSAVGVLGSLDNICAFPMCRHLLIFIAIGLSTPTFAFASVRYPVEKTRTINTLNGLRMALQYFYKEYGSVPKGDSSAILAALIGTGSNDQNPRKIAFFEFHPPRKRYYFWTVDPGDRHTSGQVMDGWGRPIVWIINPEGTRITLKSLGSNGRDDGDKADDIVVVPSLPSGAW